MQPFFLGRSAGELFHVVFKTPAPYNGTESRTPGGSRPACACSRPNCGHSISRVSRQRHRCASDVPSLSPGAQREDWLPTARGIPKNSAILEVTADKPRWKILSGALRFCEGFSAHYFTRPLSPKVACGTTIPWTHVRNDPKTHRQCAAPEESRRRNHLNQKLLSDESRAYKLSCLLNECAALIAQKSTGI
jgi:hypothetical protein